MVEELLLVLQSEEELFTQLIDKYKDHDAKWVPDVVGRALGNRGNARSRQGRLDDAIADYNASIQMCPWSLDPVLNRSAISSLLCICPLSGSLSGHAAHAAEWD